MSPRLRRRGPQPSPLPDVMNLHRAVLRAHSTGDHVPCLNRPEWISENPEERALAAALCTGCPVQVECYVAGDDTNQRHGVWGGRDFTPSRRRADARRGEVLDLHESGASIADLAQRFGITEEMARRDLAACYTPEPPPGDRRSGSPRNTASHKELHP